MIRNRSALATDDARELTLACLEAGIEAADPGRATRGAVGLDDDTLRVGDERVDLAGVDRVLVLGAGKAAAGVVRGLDAILGDRIDDGVVVVPESDAGQVGAVTLAAGGHPVPTEAGVAATRELLDLARGAGGDDLVLAVVTGGASALLAAPADGLALEDLRATTRLLLDAGADIGETNAVRRHLSAVKGGRLAVAAAPATVLGLLCSDVVGDDPAVIGSGPTAPDDSTYDDALGVLDRYATDDPGDPDVPAAVREHLERGARGDLPETPDSTHPAFERVRNRVLVSNRTAVDAAAEVALDRGFTPCVLSTGIEGEARTVGGIHVAVAAEVATAGDPVEPPAVLLSGGETTVTIAGDGVGGPNLEFCLAAALELAGRRGADPGTVVAAIDTDGLDGSTDAAGAVVSAETVSGRERAGEVAGRERAGEVASRERAADRDRAHEALDDNDSLSYLEDRGAVIRTGPTGTNVNDLRVVVVTEPAGDDVNGR